MRGAALLRSGRIRRCRTYAPVSGERGRVEGNPPGASGRFNCEGTRAPRADRDEDRCERPRDDRDDRRRAEGEPAARPAVQRAPCQHARDGAQRRRGHEEALGRGERAGGRAILDVAERGDPPEAERDRVQRLERDQRRERPHRRDQRPPHDGSEEREREEPRRAGTARSAARRRASTRPRPPCPPPTRRPRDRPRRRDRRGGARSRGRSSRAPPARGARRRGRRGSPGAPIRARASPPDGEPRRAGARRKRPGGGERDEGAPRRDGAGERGGRGRIQPSTRAERREEEPDGPPQADLAVGRPRGAGALPS